MMEKEKDSAVLNKAKELIRSSDMEPLRALISSVYHPSRNKKIKKKRFDKDVIDFMVNYFPSFLISKLVLIMGAWNEQVPTSSGDRKIHLDLLNRLLATQDEQPLNTLDPQHLQGIKKVLVTVLMRETFTPYFKDLSVAVSLVASQSFQPGNNTYREWIELPEFICRAFEDGSKLKMGLTLLRDLPLNIGKDWFMPYAKNFLAVIFVHLGDDEEEESCVLAYGALINLALQLAGTWRHRTAKHLSTIMVTTVEMLLEAKKENYVKKGFEELLVFLKRESWRCHIEQFYLLFRFLGKVTKVDGLDGEAKVAAVNVLDEVEKIGDSVKEKFQKHVSSLADVVSTITLEQKERDEASGVGRDIDEIIERWCSE